MIQGYWYKQGEEALFPDLLWSRPEVKNSAGKLLIIGGNSQSFAAAAEAYAAAEQAGVGVARVLLPDSLRTTVSRLVPDALFAPSNPSGGFAAQAFAEVATMAQWADGALLAGDIGRNSETMALLENFVTHNDGMLCITNDAADFFCTHPSGIAERPNTLLILTPGQLQKLGSALHLPYAFTGDLGLAPLVKQLHVLSSEYSYYIITRHQDSYVVAINGTIGTSDASPSVRPWQTTVAATTATWWLQNPTKPFEALMCSLASQDRGRG